MCVFVQEFKLYNLTKEKHSGFQSNQRESFDYENGDHNTRNGGIPPCYAFIGSIRKLNKEFIHSRSMITSDYRNSDSFKTCMKITWGPKLKHRSERALHNHPRKGLRDSLRACINKVIINVVVITQIIEHYG